MSAHFSCKCRSLILLDGIIPASIGNITTLQQLCEVAIACYACFVTRNASLTLPTYVHTHIIDVRPVMYSQEYNFSWFLRCTVSGYARHDRTSNESHFTVRRGNRQLSLATRLLRRRHTHMLAADDQPPHALTQ
jgi:hypothetical protein